MPVQSTKSLFKSFWMAGYECSDQLNHYGDRVDLLSITGHIDQIYQDYESLRTFNIKTVREGIRWSYVEIRPYAYDFETVRLMIMAAKECNIQQIWDICHFGFPYDLSPLHPHFTKRFVSLCKAFVAFYRSIDPNGLLIITPINEVGFLSWLGGECGSTSPYGKGMGWEVKYALVRAYIQGIDAMKQLNPDIQILTTEPIVNIVPPLDTTPEQLERTAAQHELQYQVLDMLTGRICPELGGSPDHLDILGYNYYYNNQWICDLGSFLPWRNLEPDSRWRGLSSLFSEAYERFQKPMILAETSHPKEDRPIWIAHITNECIKAIDMGIPLEGICLYPIIDRPDWDHPDNWHHSGLWDADYFMPNARILNQPYADALLASQKMMEHFRVVRNEFW